MKNTKPTLAAIAARLKLTVRRVSSLKKLGMPTATIEAALAWHKARNATGGPDSPEALRAERILLVAAQRRKVEMENRVRQDELIEAASAMESATLVAAATRAALLQLSNDTPPMLCGLSETQIRRVLRREFHVILSRLADGRFFDAPATLAIIAAAEREVKSK